MSTVSEKPAPGRRDPEGRRRAILDAAVELIVESGPASITHRAIAARAGVSLGSTTQYFASIDELRELALQRIAEGIDRSLAEMEAAIPILLTDPERALAPLHDFLRDSNAVYGELALIASGAADPSMRELARRWSDRLTEFLSPHIGRTRASALTLYLDGATVHAGLHDEPLGREEITAAIRALLAMPDASDAAAGSAAGADPATKTETTSKNTTNADTDIYNTTDTEGPHS